MDVARLTQQVQFILEIDKLKHVFRQTLLTDQSRYENDAEHSWHLAVMAILLAEYATEPQLDLPRVMKMVVIHDLVEIDAGDTFCYDQEAVETQLERERAAADRIFGMLPPDQKNEFRALWDEFEARTSVESKFANALDRLQPLLHNLNTDGGSWRAHDVTIDRVVKRCSPIGDGAPALWAAAHEWIKDAVKDGLLRG